MAARPWFRAAVAAALVTATHDRHWVIRVAALQAIAERGEPTLVGKIELLLNDSKKEVKYTAAATILRLGAPSDASKTAEKTSLNQAIPK
jgi:HEAT repeat protein